MSSIRMQRPRRALSARVNIPGSKSLTNRALIAAVLADGTSVLSNTLLADDTRRMIDTLKQLGFAIASDPRGQRLEIAGAGGYIPGVEAECFCGNSGTTMRFCTALAALGRGRYAFDGVERMRERPMNQLIEALCVLGARVVCDGEEGYPPLTVNANGLKGGTVTLDQPPSSQFVSALLLAAPAAASDVMIDVKGPLASAPYVRMTTALMATFGPAVIEDIRETSARFIVAAPQPYHAQHYRIEPDASNASYFLAAAAVAGGVVTVEGLGTHSIQGDIHFVDLLERMGCGIERSQERLTVRRRKTGDKLKALEVDLNSLPDMVQTVAVLALFADGATTIRNVANLRVKETDRLTALARELTALGAGVEQAADGLTIHPPDRIRPATINTYDDHRMAMSFALAGLGADGIVIDHPECVSKTFPNFFDEWARLYAQHT